MAAVVSGLTIVAVKQHVKLPSQDYAWPSPTICPIVSPNVNRRISPNVIKWMERLTQLESVNTKNAGRVVNTIHYAKGKVINLWGWDPETVERIRATLPVKIDPTVAAELKAKAEAEKKIEESGRGECSFCNEEIVKNERFLWESDFLLEYCTESREHKHKPKIVWKVTE